MPARAPAAPLDAKSSGPTPKGLLTLCQHCANMALTKTKEVDRRAEDVSRRSSELHHHHASERSGATRRGDRRVGRVLHDLQGSGCGSLQRSSYRRDRGHNPRKKASSASSDSGQGDPGASLWSMHRTLTDSATRTLARTRPFPRSEEHTSELQS